MTPREDRHINLLFLVTRVRRIYQHCQNPTRIVLNDLQGKFLSYVFSFRRGKMCYIILFWFSSIITLNINRMLIYSLIWKSRKTFNSEYQNLFSYYVRQPNVCMSFICHKSFIEEVCFRSFIRMFHIETIQKNCHVRVKNCHDVSIT